MNECKCALFKIFDSSSSLLESSDQNKRITEQTENYIKRISLLAEESQAFECDLSYTLLDGRTHATDLASLWQKLVLYLRLLMSSNENKKKKPVVSNMLKILRGGSIPFSDALFQFLLSDSFEYLQLYACSCDYSPVDIPSSSSSSSMPYNEGSYLDDRYDYECGDDRTLHTYDKNITLFDFHPTIGQVVHARTAKVYFLCEVLDFTTSEVLVAWQVSGVRRWLPRSTLYFEPLGDRKRPRKPSMASYPATESVASAANTTSSNLCSACFCWDAARYKFFLPKPIVSVDIASIHNAAVDNAVENSSKRRRTLAAKTNRVDRVDSSKSRGKIGTDCDDPHQECLTLSKVPPNYFT
jgi:hypothetical protein